MQVEHVKVDARKKKFRSLKRKVRAQIRRASKTDAEKMLNRAKLQAATGCRRKAIRTFQRYLVLTGKEI